MNIIQHMNIQKIEENIIYKKYTLTDKSLKEFANDMIKWTTELQLASLNKSLKSIIDYSKNFSLQGGVTSTFNYFCAKKY